MIFLIGNSSGNYSICFPLFIMQDHRVLTFPYSLMLIVEAFLTVLSVFYVVKCAYVCVRIRTFHRNMTVLIFICALQWFECAVANVLIKPYETGYWPIGEHTTTIKQWWTDDESRMVRLPSIDDLVALFVGGFIKWHYILSMCTMLLVLSIERCFACYFLNDYEKKSRNCLLFCLVFGYQGTILVAAVFFFLNAAHFVYGMLFILTPNIVAVLVFCYTRNFNLKITSALEDFANPHHNYSLAARFQARENMRCFQMILRVIISAVLLIFFACAVNLVIFLDVAPNLDTLWNLLFENSINSNPLLICPTLILSVDAWRKFSFSANVCQRIKMRRVKVSSVSTDTMAVARTDQTRKETDAYFNQLNAAWT